MIIVGCSRGDGWSSPPEECDQFYDTEERKKACNDEKGGDVRSEECNKVLREAYLKCHELTGYEVVDDQIFTIHWFGSLKDIKSGPPLRGNDPPTTKNKPRDTDKK